MTTTITVEREGRRSYIVGPTYPHRDALRAAGARWDPDRRAWWLADDARARAVAAQLAAATPPDAAAQRPTTDGERTVVGARATYRDRACYVVGRSVGRGWDERVQLVSSRDGTRLLLCSRDGARQWWAAEREVRIVKRYSRPQTIGGLRKFAQDLREGRIEVCPNCGSPSCSAVRGGGLCDED